MRWRAAGCCSACASSRPACSANCCGRAPRLIGLVGFAAIAGVWYRGGESWLGLLTALVGMVGGGAMVWAVRIVGSAALRKEAMGFGDVTLMMMIGAFLGWQPTIFIFFIAPFAGLVDRRHADDPSPRRRDPLRAVPLPRRPLR